MLKVFYKKSNKIVSSEYGISNTNKKSNKIVNFEGEISNAKNAPLGNNTESNTPKSEKIALKVPSLLNFGSEIGITKKYLLQSVIKEILGACEHQKSKSKFYRFGACKQLSAPLTKIEHLQLKLFGMSSHIYPCIQKFIKEDETIKASFGGLCSCNSVWICPVCSSVLASWRAKEVEQALHLHKKIGNYALFVTFTIRHTRQHTLNQSLVCLSKSVRSLKQGKAWTDFKQKWGFIGSVNSTEYTYTLNNGHHPHSHQIFFLTKKPDLKQIKDWLFKRYSKFIVKHNGFEAPSYKRGVDIKLCFENKKEEELNNPEHLALYLSKSPLDQHEQKHQEPEKIEKWGAAQELTLHQYKINKASLEDRNKLKSYNSIELVLEYMYCLYLLYLAGEFSDKQAIIGIKKKLMKFKKLYIEYAEEFFGKRQLVWSRGLKKRFFIYDMKDEEITNNFDKSNQVLMNLDYDTLCKIVKFRLRARVLKVVEDTQYKTDEERILAVNEFLNNVKHTERFG